jgi:hypothetical protein
MSEDELEDQEYIDKLERFGQRIDYREFKMHHPVSDNVPE